MKKDEVQRVAFEIILSSGNGRELVHEAFRLMREGHYENAESKLEEANEAIVVAHQSQTELLTAYAGGEEIVIEIIMVHAQDHLMTSMTLREVAIEMLELYRKMEKIVE